LRETAFRCLETAKHLGAAYADVRMIHTVSDSISVKDERVDALVGSESHGLGVRVILDGAWGFASTCDLAGHSPEACARLACAIAKASSTVMTEPARVAPQEPIVAAWNGPCEEDPFSIPLQERIGVLDEAVRILRREEPRILVAQGSMVSSRHVQLFASTDGADIQQGLTITGAGIEATAPSAGGDLVRRSYPDAGGGQFEKRGYELVRALDLAGNAPRVAEELGRLIDAPMVQPGKTTLIISSDQLALQIHESIGHPLELDRIFGMEASFAGTSFVRPHDLGKLEYASKLVSVTADATIPGAMGSFGYDDEGVPAQRVPLIVNGLLVGVLSGRETAARLGPGHLSGGAMRADGYNRIPLVRMTNVSLEPGEGTLEDLIADTSDGLLLSTNRSWSIDDRRLNFQFATEIGWRIKDGRLGEVVRNPAYSGMTLDFWRSCDAIAGADDWKVHGTPNCGKGEPMQVIGTGHGAAPARFRGVDVGVAQ
jgi:TldD protein